MREHIGGLYPRYEKQSRRTLSPRRCCPPFRPSLPSLQAVALAWVQPSQISATRPGYYSQSFSAAVANSGLVTGTACFAGLPWLGTRTEQSVFQLIVGHTVYGL